MTETINEGTYGVVFAVRDVETATKGVIKVAKSVGNDAGNQAAEWEGFVLEKIYKSVSILFIFVPDHNLHIYIYLFRLQLAKF